MSSTSRSAGGARHFRYSPYTTPEHNITHPSSPLSVINSECDLRICVAIVRDVGPRRIYRGELLQEFISSDLSPSAY